MFTIISTVGCANCNQAEMLCRMKKVDHEKVDVNDGYEHFIEIHKEEERKKGNTRATFPIVLLDGEYIGDHNSLYEMIARL